MGEALGVEIDIENIHRLVIRENAMGLPEGNNTHVTRSKRIEEVSGMVHSPAGMDEEKLHHIMIVREPLLQFVAGITLGGDPAGLDDRQVSRRENLDGRTGHEGNHACLDERLDAKTTLYLEGPDGITAPAWAQQRRHSWRSKLSGSNESIKNKPVPAFFCVLRIEPTAPC